MASATDLSFWPQAHSTTQGRLFHVLPELQASPHAAQIQKPQVIVPVQDLADQYGIRYPRPPRQKPSPERGLPKYAQILDKVAAETAPPGATDVDGEVFQVANHAATADFAGLVLPPVDRHEQRQGKRWSPSGSRVPFGASEASDTYWAATNERPCIVRLDLTSWHGRGQEFQEELAQLRKDVNSETSQQCRQKARQWREKNNEWLKEQLAAKASPRYTMHARLPRQLSRPKLQMKRSGGSTQALRRHASFVKSRKKRLQQLSLEGEESDSDDDAEQQGMALVNELRKRREKEKQLNDKKSNAVMQQRLYQQEQKRLEEARDRKERLLQRQREGIRRQQALEKEAARRGSRKSLAGRASIAFVPEMGSARRSSVAVRKSIIQPNHSHSATHLATPAVPAQKPENEDSSPDPSTRSTRSRKTVEIGEAVVTEIEEKPQKEKSARMKRFETRANMKRKDSKHMQQKDSDNESDISGGEPSSPRDISRGSSFDMCMHIANMYKVPLQEVKHALEDYYELDSDGDGFLSFEEFENVIRKQCSIPEGEEVPEHLMLKQWKEIDKDGSNSVDFVEYFQWTLRSGWKEDLMVPNSSDRELRQLARDNGVTIVEVEKLKRMFDAFDVDGSGFIDQEEFKAVLCQAMGVKDPSEVSQNQLQRYWKEADSSNSGELGLQEFMIWYINVYQS
mmetsp:Transcript_44548/g.80055  ORF Transcript_44548/g.80055 Transcript_44548/m.80055 type:complete len:681 (+) Transcript_44548:60-2102(+)|eukprot:CAMPEP_0197629874 /NCGR_PEP_ID=MMETSP1338-20131121/7553_1 /TAXON_ID=43686 ORGANISM="Pelagodinium beii, Strain RCC1491" /NCGR_SAMPLE_ID=MMETSP1338 /ASSEMBLY_ACC=CAM_ASM_000754 /LENGTH=680 /DNA_ID=CAMNT_0043200983 /DNA_START=54 /DNA_END=2096 /DNA_ORIENTATION=+